jgi:hypothetical protein
VREFFFGHQEELKTLMGPLQRGMKKNIKFSTLYRNFTESLMHYRTEHGKPAFEVD